MKAIWTFCLKHAGKIETQPTTKQSLDVLYDYRNREELEHNGNHDNAEEKLELKGESLYG